MAHITIYRITKLGGLWLLWLGCCLGMTNLGLAQTFSLEADKSVVYAGDPFQVYIRMVNMPTGQVSYPDFGRLQRITGPNRFEQRNVDYISGKAYSEVAYSFMLRAMEPGTYTINPATLTVGKKVHKTESLKITVRAGKNPAAKSSPTDRRSNPGSRDMTDDKLKQQAQEALLVRALSSKTSVYQGEQISISYKIYNQINGSPSPFKEDYPKLEGFWLEKMKLPLQRPKEERYNGKVYNTYLYDQFVLFPQRPGQITIDPMTLWFRLQFEEAWWRPGRPFVHQTSTEPITLTVKPLPPNAPENFSGLVGKMQVTSVVDQQTIKTGDAFKVTLRLDGQGNMKKVTAPTLALPADKFEVYDPQVKERMIKEGGIVRGIRQYEYLVVPKQPGDYTLSPASISYFDPEAANYVNLAAEEITLKVVGLPQSGAGSAAAMANGGIGESRPIHYTYHSSPENTSFFGSPLFWGLFLSPIMVLLAMGIWRQRSLINQADVVGNRIRQATKMAQKRLKQANTYLSEGQEKAFYDEVVRALWGYLGDKLNMRQADLSRDQVRAQLSAQHVSTELQDRVVKLLDECEMALFAPSAISGGMQATYQEAMELLADLDDHLSKTVKA